MPGGAPKKTAWALVVARQVPDRPLETTEMMLHEFDVVSIVRLGAELEISVDVQGVAGNTLEQVHAVICGHDMGDAVRQMVDRRSRRVLALQ